VIMLDVMLPDMDGYEVCRRLKKEERTRFIPVIMVTALDGIDDKIKGIEAGASDFLNKPVNEHELLARVKALVQFKRLNDHLENTENVLFTLAETVEAKDQYTKKHIERLGDYSFRLAGCVGLPVEMQEILRYGGILHDIGKIGISDKILCKPGALTKEEFEKVKEHSVVGEKIVRPLRFSDDVAPIVRGHHERYDGKGYPDGLAGEKIPLGARIVAVVDSYDAMTSDRPYRSRMSGKKAVKILQEESGTQWDAGIVNVFVEMVRSGRV